MAFWGVEVKPGKPFTLKATEASRIRRLHLSQVTLGIGNATNRSILQCNVGNKSPLSLCVLSPEKVDSCQLNLEFEEADEVIFSVFGPRSLHLTGYFLGRSTGLRPNDDESESYGEDIVDTDMEKGSSDDYDYSDSFINDDDPYGRGSHMSSTDDDEDRKIQKGSKIPLKEKSKSSVVINSDNGEGKNMLESHQNEKPATDEEIKSSSDATLSKKRKRGRKEEITYVQKTIYECFERKKQAVDKNLEKEAGTKKPLESEASSNVVIEEIEKGKLDGKSAVKGKKVSILYTGKLKDSGKLFDSNLGKAPLKFRLGEGNVIEGLSIGVEGMRVGDKRRIIIPPSLGYSEEERLKKGVPKKAWLVYEVEAVKVR